MLAASDTAMPNPNAAQTTYRSRRLRPEPRMSAVDASSNSPSTDSGHRPALGGVRTTAQREHPLMFIRRIRRYQRDHHRTATTNPHIHRCPSPVQVRQSRSPKLNRRAAACARWSAAELP